MLADHGLIHMNGRVYDATLGRFISADPHVDGASDAQGYNRYSYVGNNPLGATDPTGFFSLKDIFKIVAVVVLSIVTYGAASAWATAFLYANTAMFMSTAITIGSIVGGAAAGFVAGFAGSLLNGGSVGDAFKSGLIGGISGALTAGIGIKFGAIGSKGPWNEFKRAFAHGAVGGAVEEASGGEFRHGFYSSFAGSVAGSIAPSLGMGTPGDGDFGKTTLRTAFAAVVGGTTSELGGGKFANGAQTAAFQHLFNAESGALGKKHSRGDIDIVDISVEFTSVYSDKFLEMSDAFDSILEIADYLDDASHLLAGSPMKILTSYSADEAGELVYHPLNNGKAAKAAIGKNVNDWPPFVARSTLTYRMYLGEKTTSFFGFFAKTHPHWSGVRTEYANVIVPGIFKTKSTADDAAFAQMRLQLSKIRERGDAYRTLFD